MVCMENKSLNIIHMFPDLLNLYGDKGNIECMRRRLTWRGFDVNITEHTSRSGSENIDMDIDLDSAGIIFIGGGSDREQVIVSEKLLQRKAELTAYVERGGVLIAVCGGFQLLGNYYKTADGKIEGLGILDIYTERSNKRLIGNVAIKSTLSPTPIIGFENHAGRTYIGGHMPLGEVLSGRGNDGTSGEEGVLYKNVIATYLHGPLLPKNPALCDYALLKALQNKYPEITSLTALDDGIEASANEYMAKRMNI